MDNYSGFDRLNVPMYFCDRDWKVLFRNTACKKYTKAPRVSGNMSRFFIDGENVEFPKENGGLYYVCCYMKGTYKTAVYFEYHGNAVILFSSFLEYDVLLGGVSVLPGTDVADSIRGIFDLFMYDDIALPDKFGRLEKIRNYLYSVVDNYVAFTMLRGAERVDDSFVRIFGFFRKYAVMYAGKAGYKIELDLSGLGEDGDGIYTDVMYFTLVFSNFMLFALSLAKDGKCRITCSNIGHSVRNEITVTCPSDIFDSKRGDSINDLARLSVVEYLNFLPFEELGKVLGWRFGYQVTESEEGNVHLYLDIDHSDEAVFRSPEGEKQLTPEQIISDIFAELVF